MELVYLWVEKYKNIEKQGFNFLPRFRCHYDEKTEKLEIIDKDETGEFYPKNFFGDNINITAIVGENGSGKTSLINFINTSLNVITKNKFLLLFLNNNKKYYRTNLNLSQKALMILKKLNFKRSNYVPLKNIIINTKSYNIENTLRFFISIFNEVEKNLFFNPNTILIKENQEKKLEIISELLENIREKEKLEKELLKINIYILDVINKSFNNNDYINFLCDEYEYKNEFYDEIQKLSLRSILEKNNFYKEFLSYLLNLLIALNNHSEKPTNPFPKYIRNIEVSYLFRNIQKVNSIVDFLHELNECKFISPEDEDYYDEEIDLTFEKDCSDYLDLEENFINKKIELPKIKIKKIKKFKELLCFDFFDDKDVSFNNFSEGEKNLFLSNLEIYFQFLNGNKIILLDEIELSLHPQWQKYYINNLLKIFKFNNVHLIFVTHSPFLLSDIPKENVIFLEKDEKTGNCINVTNKVDINPFGANIHTLLSHGFFMKDGLMGEFAKNKISKILNFLNGKNKFIDTPINQIKPIIEIIGEDFLREKLLKMYNEKFGIKSKDDEIKELKAEIERLKDAQNKI
ncbi:ATP-binding protein [Aliarcobacter butzleri]|uniref:ATP-binding protein n=1 Tax=Aliarcobacter butzleri TaxID=28197 RepID=UPI0021B46556|nr:ATP-binding protein [Aliarcobacter butzleri]MCT7616427.1 ATP-binding protein [Aliarcobacter butzleri]